MDDNFDNKINEGPKEAEEIENREENNVAGATNMPYRTNDAQNNIRTYSMDEHGNIRSDKTGAAAVSSNTRTFIILGWICAGLTAFITAYFAIAGIVFGVLANRRARGSGNSIIITNVALAVINMIFSFIIFRGY